MKKLILGIIILLSGCANLDHEPNGIAVTIESQTGRTLGYIREDGAITDITGRVTGYLE